MARASAAIDSAASGCSHAILRKSPQLFQQIDADSLEALTSRFAPTKQ